MAGRRRLAAVLVLAVALMSAVVVGQPSVDNHGTPATHAGGASVQPVKAQPGLVPGTRTVEERLSLVVVAVLTVLVGVGSTRRSLSRRFRRRLALAAVWRHALRLRGPPALQFV